jgi:tetratricopeptide (TPR) repeat protein
MIKEADHREREIALIRRAGVFHGLAVQAQKEFADLAVVVPYAKKAIIYQSQEPLADKWCGSSENSISPQESIKKTLELEQKAVSMDDSDSMNHILLGRVCLLMRQYEKAIAQEERAVELDPNGAMAHGIFGKHLVLFLKNR